jgi:hypothetical protein
MSDIHDFYDENECCHGFRFISGKALKSVALVIIHIIQCLICLSLFVLFFWKDVNIMPIVYFVADISLTICYFVEVVLLFCYWRIVCCFIFVNVNFIRDFFCIYSTFLIFLYCLYLLPAVSLGVRSLNGIFNGMRLFYN